MIDDRYRVLTHFGQGGMGSVYCAEHLGLGRQVAVKVLRREHSENPQFRLRFEREIRATAAIHHPHVVSVFDTGVLPDGSLYYTMELIDGESLQARLRRERIIAWSSLHPLVLQISRGLEAAHSLGIVHRDLKPGNIVVMARPGEPEQTKIIDFGIAKLVRDQSVGKITKTGAVVGTLAYMAPEQLRGLGDHRIDIYALGVILYQCLAGRRPFVGSEVEVFGAILHTNPEPLCKVAAAPAMLSSLVMQMMARSPEDRPQTMGAVAEALLKLDEQAPLPSQPDSARTVPLAFGDAAPVFGGSSDTTGSRPTRVSTKHTLTPDGRTLSIFGGVLALGLAGSIAWALGSSTPDIDEFSSPTAETAAADFDTTARRSPVEGAATPAGDGVEATRAQSTSVEHVDMTVASTGAAVELVMLDATASSGNEGLATEDATGKSLSTEESTSGAPRTVRVTQTSHTSPPPRSKPKTARKAEKSSDERQKLRAALAQLMPKIRSCHSDSFNRKLYISLLIDVSVKPGKPEITKIRVEKMLYEDSRLLSPDKHDLVIGCLNRVLLGTAVPGIETGGTFPRIEIRIR